MTFEIPAHLDWFFWRVLSSQYVDIRMVDLSLLTVQDIQDAHDFLDVYEEAVARSRPRS